MLCPSCGKEVANSDALCGSCGTSLAPPNPASGKSVAHAGEAAPPGTVGHAPGIRRNALVSLILGLLPFVLLVPAFKLGDVFHGAWRPILWGYLASAAAEGLLAVISGRRVKGVNPRSERRSAAGVMAFFGRTLGYLGLVLGIFFLALAIFLPWFVSSSRTSANQFVAKASLREIDAAAAIYAATYGQGFPSTLAALGPAKYTTLSGSPEVSDNAAGLVDEYVADGLKSSFKFTYIAGPPGSSGRIQSYAVHADPIDAERAGNIHYFTDQSGVIRQEEGKQADVNSKPIAG
jgi:type II secretory pathway pseudopilin PulG